jgi:hypothetical protein
LFGPRIIYGITMSRGGTRPITIRVRALNPEETGQLAELARSRKRGAGLGRRAQIVLHAVEEQLSAPEIAARMGLCGETVRFWLKRFNERGLGGLAEDMRSGRPRWACRSRRGRWTAWWPIWARTASA